MALNQQPPLAAHFRKRTLRPITPVLDDEIQRSPSAAAAAASAPASLPEEGQPAAETAVSPPSPHPTSSADTTTAPSGPRNASVRRRARRKATRAAHAEKASAAPKLDDGSPVLHEEDKRVLKVMTRLSSKLLEKRRAFTFDFAIGDEGEPGRQHASAEPAACTEADEIDRLVREIEGQSIGGPGAAGKKKKKRGRRGVQEQKSESLPAEDTAAAAAAAKEPQEAPPPRPLPAEDAGNGASRPAPAKPPGLDHPSLLSSSSSSSSSTAKQQSQQRSKAHVVDAAPSAAIQLHSASAEGLSEEERARRRFGQGTRNLGAIAARQQRALGVIGGGAEEGAKAEAGVEKEQLTAFTFGFF